MTFVKQHQMISVSGEAGLKWVQGLDTWFKCCICFVFYPLLVFRTMTLRFIVCDRRYNMKETYGKENAHIDATLSVSVCQFHREFCIRCASSALSSKPNWSKPWTRDPKTSSRTAIPNKARFPCLTVLLGMHFQISPFFQPCNKPHTIMGLKGLVSSAQYWTCTSSDLEPQQGQPFTKSQNWSHMLLLQNLTKILCF